MTPEEYPADFVIPEPTGEELGFVGQMHRTYGLAILDSRIDHKLLNTLGKLSKLYRLVLFNCQIGDDELQQIVDSLPLPETLGVLNLRGTLLTDQGLSSLKNLTDLQVLIIDQSKLDGSGILNLKTRHLSYLGLPNSQLDDANLKKIIERWGGELTSLDLSNTRVSNAGLKELIDLPKLASLRIGGTLVTPQGVRDFLERRSRLEVQQLKQLSLAGFSWGGKELDLINLPNRWEELDLSGWKLSDADLEKLPVSKHLQTLKLSRTDITDAGVAFLNRIPSLRRLYLRGTQVTNAGLEIALEMRGTYFLEVGETQITFEDLMDEKFPSGRMRLDVSGMNLTVEQLRKLAKRRPEGEVYQDDRTFMDRR